MKNAYLAVLTIGSILAVGLAFAGGQYDPGVSDTEIKIGNTMPYSSRCRVRFYRIRPFGATLGRNWSAKAGAKKGVPLLDWLLRSVNRLPFLEISQNRETGESPEEVFEGMSTEDEAAINYMIGELKQLSDRVQQHDDEPIESPGISGRKQQE